MTDLSWLLLLYGLPAKQSAARLALWRQLKRLGAVALKTSAYVLPDRPELYEGFQWLAQRVREQGGESTLVRVADVDGVSDDELVQMFQRARSEDYTQIINDVRPLLPTKKQRKSSASAEDIEKIAARYETVRKVDYFDCPKAADVEQLLSRLTSNTTPAKAKVLSVKSYLGRTWLTRPRPEVDRVGSAWLIQRFIDPKAPFVFAAEASAHPEALPYDMLGAEFGHHGNDCTFETLLKRFALDDTGLARVAAVIHDADLDDGRNGTTEGDGLLAIFRGWAQMGWSDQDILSRGFECFDALHKQFSTRSRKVKESSK
jgi:hypothetical protein